MTRPGSAHSASCSCNTCTGGVIQVVVPGTGGGVQGTQGVQGRTGTQGALGTTGAQGTQGVQGRQGTQGGTGTQGIQGLIGSGTQGVQGLQGFDGGGITLQQLNDAIADAIAGAALESTDDLPEGVTNRYYKPDRVSYTHMQGVATDTWVITHNLGFYPNVTVVDSGGSIVEGEITYTNSNSLTATFQASFSGTAYLS